MIPVGIHENVRVYKATRNEKGTLVVGFKRDEGLDLDSFDTASDNTAGGDAEQDFLLFPPSNLDRKDAVDSTKNNSAKVKQLKDQLTHILGNYMTSDKITWNTTLGTGLTQENSEAKLKTQETLNKMYDNICNQFIEQVTPFLNNTKLKFRVIFVRHSEAKHYPSLRKTYLSTQPFMEPMSVPAATSRIKFTEWEIKNKRNTGDKLTATETPAEENAEVAQTAFATTPDDAQ